MPAYRNTAANDSAMAISYEITCALERMPAQQGVGGAGCPARQDDSVHADGRDGQHVQHRDGHVRQLQRRLMAEHAHHATHRNDGEGHDRGGHRDDRCQKVDRLVHACGDQALLERELDAVGEALQQPPRSDPIGPWAELHPAEHLAFEQDRDQHGEHQEHEDAECLGKDQPQRIVAERGQVRVLHADSPSATMATTVPTDAPNVAATADPAELSGSHTTRSGISVTSSGNEMAPRGLLTVTRSPSVGADFGRGGSESRTTAGRAVPARNASPS